MANNIVDGHALAHMFTDGATNLLRYVDVVDSLNVFPVPDGDTGTNMNLSITAGVKEVKQSTKNEASTVAAAFAKGLLMGARGNSGVILSQLFRGFSQYLEGKDSMTADDFSKALDQGVETAYKAVMKPVEGTILTVAKDAANEAMKIAEKNDDLVYVMEKTLLAAKASLKRTPDLLPILKEVGVVDAGGQGLVYIYEGFLAVLKGEKTPEAKTTHTLLTGERVPGHQHAQSYMATEDIEFGFCTEVMVRLEEERIAANHFDENEFRHELSELGDSLLVVSDKEFLKVHIHVEHPGEILTRAQRYGELITIKIENMREQHANLLEKTKGMDGQVEEQSNKLEKSEFGIVTVSMGDGIANVFKGLGAGVIVSGGQTMNPSTEQIVQAIQKVHAKNVIVLPNNENIILAAEQAAKIVDANVVVVPSTTIPQGVAAILACNPLHSLDVNVGVMNQAMDTVKTGQVTFSIRDTNIDGIQINKDDFMGITEKKIVSSGFDVVQVTQDLLTQMLEEDSDIITLFQGEDATDEQTGLLEAFLERSYPDVELDIYKGNQPIYSYIVSVE